VKSKKKILIIGHSGGLAQEINYQLKDHYNLKFLSRQQVDAYTDYKKYFYVHFLSFPNLSKKRLIFNNYNLFGD
jgi:short-subunit dehydrogenase